MNKSSPEPGSHSRLYSLIFEGMVQSLHPSLPPCVLPSLLPSLCLFALCPQSDPSVLSADRDRPPLLSSNWESVKQLQDQTLSAPSGGKLKHLDFTTLDLNHFVFMQWFSNETEAAVERKRKTPGYLSTSRIISSSGWDTMGTPEWALLLRVEASAAAAAAAGLVGQSGRWCCFPRRSRADPGAEGS